MISRIKKRADFVKASQEGVSFRSPSLVVLARPRETDEKDAIRSGFTASKRVGNAVARNRCKRRMRAVCDQYLTTELSKYGHNGSIDIVLIATRKTSNISFDCLCRDFQRAIKFCISKQAL